VEAHGGACPLFAMTQSGAERITRLLTVTPVCYVADAVAAAASRGASWPSVGGFPLLQPACAALRLPSYGRKYSDYRPSLHAWCAAHGPALAAQTLLFACLLIPAARALVDRCSDALGRVALSTPSVRAGKRPLNVAKLRKWREASWKLCSYGALTLFGLQVTLRQPWAVDSMQLWKGWPQHEHRCVRGYLALSSVPLSTEADTVVDCHQTARRCGSSTPGRWGTT
jgi:hypothetical protein